MEGLSTVWW